MIYWLKPQQKGIRNCFIHIYSRYFYFVLEIVWFYYCIHGSIYNVTETFINIMSFGFVVNHDNKKVELSRQKIFDLAPVLMILIDIFYVLDKKNSLFELVLLNV